MLKDFLGEPDDIALVGLGPIVVTGHRPQELGPAEGTKLGDNQIGHRIPKSLNVFGDLVAIFSFGKSISMPKLGLHLIFYLLRSAGK
jgi:hypothetical protein